MGNVESPSAPQQYTAREDSTLNYEGPSLGILEVSKYQGLNF